MKKLNIAVIFGGCSPEYSVSLESAHAVITHMDRTKYSPVLVGISPKGNWLHFTGAVEKIKQIPGTTLTTAPRPWYLLTGTPLGFWFRQLLAWRRFL